MLGVTETDTGVPYKEGSCMDVEELSAPWGSFDPGAKCPVDCRVDEGSPN